MSALEDAALAYAEQGIHVFPLAPRAKTPLTAHGLEDATTDPLTIETWWSRWPDANVGIRTGDIVVIDEDELGLIDSLEGGTIPETRVAKTANGRHFYFTQPDGQRVRNTAGRLATGIDTRGDGGYVVAPPSVHPSGATYEWIADTAPAQLPEWLAAKLVRQQPERQPMPDIPLFGTTPYGKKALDEEILNVIQAPEGTRNHTLNTAAFALGQLVGGREVDQADAWRSLEAAGVSAGLTATETRKTLTSGFQAGLESPRSAPVTNGHRPALRVVGHVESQAPPQPAMFPTENWDDFSELAAAPIEFLVQGLWPEQSLGFIASPPKKGKTWLGLSLAISVSAGVSFLGEFAVPRQRKVLYLALEGGRRAMLDRIGSLCRGMQVNPERGSGELDNLIMSYRPRGIDLADEAWAQGLTQVVAENDVELVIVDVLRNAARIKETDASEFAHLRILLEDTLKISSVALLHHFTKLSEISKERTPAERMSGSGAMYGALDVGMFITGSEENGRRLRVEFDGRDIAMPDTLSVRLDGDGSGPNGGFTFTDSCFWTGDIPEVAQASGKVNDEDIRAVLGDGKMRRGKLVAAVTEALQKKTKPAARTVEAYIDSMRDARPARLFDIPIDVAGEKGWYTFRPDLYLPDFTTQNAPQPQTTQNDDCGADRLEQRDSDSATQAPQRDDSAEQDLAQPSRLRTTQTTHPYGESLSPAEQDETHPSPASEDLDWT